jgi:hypothetical protein
MDSLIDSVIADRIVMPRSEPLHSVMRHIPEPRGREAFYCSWRANLPVMHGALTCELWRHQTDDEIFEFEIMLDEEVDAHGVVECAVHAENLTKPEQSKVIIERKIEAISMLDLARSLVESCAG